MEEMSFHNLTLSAETLRAIDDAGYTQMTPIQAQAIPVILSGKDAIGQSSTGTGKTAAFGIPAVELVQGNDEGDPEVLVLCPTRELAMQVSEELRKFSKYKEGLRVVAVYGGQNIDTQIRALKRASIVVGTPGRVIDHLRRRTLKLQALRMVVLDEADEMLDMGFLDDIKQILWNTPDEKQTLLFSATMPDPIVRITQRFLKKPEYIKGDQGETAFELIDQYYCEVPKSKKAHSIKLLFEQQGAQRGLIFCNTKRMVDILAESLTEQGLAVQGLHGDMRQGARTEVMKKFKDGSLNLLIATDVAARGIDASGVDIIINYDIPQDAEYYVHRIGRTGRAGKQGVAFTLIAGSGELFDLCDITDLTGVQLKPYYLQGLEATEEDKFFARNSSKSERSRHSTIPKPAGSKRTGAPDDNAVIAIDVGSNHDITERQIVNSILKYARIKKEEIGAITIMADESRIEFAPDVARHVMRTMQDATVNDFVVVLRAVTPKLNQNKGGKGGKGGQNRGGNRGGQNRGGHRGGQNRGNNRGRRG